MKQLFASIMLSLSALSLFSQAVPCQDFNVYSVSSDWESNGSCSYQLILDNWHATQAKIEYQSANSQEGNSDKYLHIRDLGSPPGTCGSWVFNNTDYKGNWARRNQCFCYDFRFFQGGWNDNPPTLLRIYSGANNPFDATYEAEFVLYESIGTADGWVKICPPIKTATTSLPSNEQGYWVMRTPEGGGVADWNNLISNVAGIAFKVDINSGTEEYGIDNICFQDCPQTYCCEGSNLVKNGGFEDGNVAFSSEFMYQDIEQEYALFPGQYGVMNGAEAANVSSNWEQLNDPENCANINGNFLIVNGENGGGDTPSQLSNSIPASKVIWEQTITVQDWKGYKFCMKAKNLDQCAFNVPPKIEVQFSMDVGNITETIEIDPTACDWQEITKHINLWGYGTSLNIKIVLDQSEFGDGNDLAIDDIALIQLEKVEDQYTLFQTNPVYLGNGNWNVTVNASVPLEEGCGAAWSIKAIDPETQEAHEIYNAPQWWSTENYDNSTNFPGYIGTPLPPSVANSLTPGLFDPVNISYRIRRGVFCDCRSWNSWETILRRSSNGRYLEVVDANNQRVLKRLRLPRSSRR